MGKARKTYKPSDPAEARRLLRERERNPEQWGINATTLTLAANYDIHVEQATRKTVERARRYDVYALLHARKSLSEHAHNAVRRLQDEIAARRREEGSRPEPVPGHHGSVELVTVRSLEAGRAVDRVLGVSDRPEDAGLGLQRELYRRLFDTLANSTAANWRAHVQFVTGDHRKPQQVNYVVRMCEALVTAYVEIDRGVAQPKRAVA